VTDDDRDPMLRSNAMKTKTNYTGATDRPTSTAQAARRAAKGEMHLVDRPSSTAQAARRAAKGEMHLVDRPSSQTSLAGRGARGHSVHSRDRPGVAGHAGARLGADRRRAMPGPDDESPVEYGPLHGPGALSLGRSDGLLDLSQFERLAPVFGAGVSGRAAKGSEVFGAEGAEALQAARGGTRNHN